MALEYPYEQHPDAGTTVEIVPGVRWLTMPLGGSLTHINLYLLEDHDGWFVVDTGLATQETHDLWHKIFDSELGGKPVKGVICTHMHPDHTGQAGMITDEFRVPLYMTRAEYYQARSFSGMGGSHHSGWLGEQFYHQYGMPEDYMAKVAQMWQQRMQNDKGSSSMAMPTTLPTGYRRIQDGDVLTIGEHDWTVEVGSGHSPEHACLHCHSLGLFISGDQILPVITSNVSVHVTEPEANPLGAWMESLSKLLRTPERTFVLPAHNLPFYGVRERLRDLMSHHEDRMLAIEESCAEEPRTARDLLPVLFKRELDARQMMMALGEAIAHCHLLMHRNRIERTLEEDGRYRFHSVDPDLARRAHPGSHDAPDDQPIMV